MKRPPLYVVLPVLLAACLVASCDSSVNPYVGNAPPYTMWGMMNAGADTQVVRVFTVEERSGLDRAGAIDAVVRSTDLTTGETHQWHHREVDYGGGEVGHVFWSDFRPEQGHRYEVSVTRSDGETSRATVTVPEGVRIHLDPTTTDPRLPVIVEGDVERTRLLGVEMVYEATNLPPANVWPPGRNLHPPVFHPVEVSYQGTGQPVAEGWRFFVDLASDYEIVRGEYERNCLVTAGAPDISLRRVEFRLVAADSAWWPPNGEFDPEALVQPGAFSNVENGFGFIGAGEVVNVRWTPVSEVRERVGYRYDQPCLLIPSDTPACNDPPIPCIGENPLSIWDVFL